MAIRFAGFGGPVSAVGSRFFDVLFGVEALLGGLLSADSVEKVSFGFHDRKVRA